MVGKVKKWLGIDVLEKENLTLAKAAQAQSVRISSIETDLKQAFVEIADLKNGLTAEPEQPKIEPKPAAPRRVNWRQAQAALEKASDP
jgi:hypothetical protein